MPSAAHLPCRVQGCAGYQVQHGYCGLHQQRAQVHRQVKQVLPYQLQYCNRRYMRMRAAFMQCHPLCAVCRYPSQVMDHITPHRGDSDLFWNQANWQALCKPCHDAKTHREGVGRAMESRRHPSPEAGVAHE